MLKGKVLEWGPTCSVKMNAIRPSPLLPSLPIFLSLPPCYPFLYSSFSLSLPPAPLSIVIQKEQSKPHHLSYQCWSLTNSWITAVGRNRTGSQGMTERSWTGSQGVTICSGRGSQCVTGHSRTESECVTDLSRTGSQCVIGHKRTGSQCVTIYNRTGSQCVIGHKRTGSQCGTGSHSCGDATWRNTTDQNSG